MDEEGGEGEGRGGRGVDREGLICRWSGVEGQVGEGKGAESHARSEAGKTKTKYIHEIGGARLRKQLGKQSWQQTQRQAPRNYLAEFWPRPLPQQHTPCVVSLYEIPPPGLEPGSLG